MATVYAFTYGRPGKRFAAALAGCGRSAAAGSAANSDVCVLVTPRSTANGTTGERKHIAGSSAVPVVSS